MAQCTLKQLIVVLLQQQLMALAEMLSFAINDVKVDNIVQIVTDNASNCVSMGHILEANSQVLYGLHVHPIV